jgi:hypothetical protein
MNNKVAQSIPIWQIVDPTQLNAQSLAGAAAASVGLFKWEVMFNSSNLPPANGVVLPTESADIVVPASGFYHVIVTMTARLYSSTSNPPPAPAVTLQGAPTRAAIYTIPAGSAEDSMSDTLWTIGQTDTTSLQVPSVAAVVSHSALVYVGPGRVIRTAIVRLVSTAGTVSRFAMVPQVTSTLSSGTSIPGTPVGSATNTNSEVTVIRVA